MVNGYQNFGMFFGLSLEKILLLFASGFMASLRTNSV